MGLANMLPRRRRPRGIHCVVMTALFLLLVSTQCQGADLKKDLTLFATFDSSTDAATALGDKSIYSAPSYKEQDAAKPGLHVPEVTLAPGQGRRGGALRFSKKNTRAVFYRTERNLAFDPSNWTGSVSFWLNLDPEQDLEPGFCDPIQITDKAYNDSAIWVDFTKDERPRHFRLGVFGALKSWNPQNFPSDKNPDFAKRLVVVKRHPFARGKWTHVAITWNGLGGGKGSATLYVEGTPRGTAENIKEPFAWDPARGALRLGVNFVGLLDEVAVFRRALTAVEIQSLAAGNAP